MKETSVQGAGLPGKASQETDDTVLCGRPGNAQQDHLNRSSGRRPNSTLYPIWNRRDHVPLAVDELRNQQGEEADFIDIVVWRRLAETCANHLFKGRLVAVEGRLQIRSYDDQNGIRRKAAEIIADNVRFLDRASDGGGQQSESSHGQTAFEPEPDFDDVPF